MVVLVASAAGLLSGCRSGGSREAFCAKAPDVPVVRDVATLGEPEGRDQVDELLSSLQGLRDASPGEVRNDVNTLVAVTRDLRDALDDAAEGKTGRPASDLQQNLDDYAAASARIVEYASRWCGIDLTTPTTAAPTTVPPTNATSASEPTATTAG